MAEDGLQEENYFAMKYVFFLVKKYNEKIFSCQ